MEDTLKEIAEKCVPEKLSIKEILNIPLIHASVMIQIHNNKIYSYKKTNEERNIQILRQLHETAKHHNLPNVIFVFNTMDQYSYPWCSHPIFTHAKLMSYPNCRHILAPCFSFDYLYKHKEKIYHEDSMLDILNKSQSYMTNIETWLKKEEKVSFIGGLYLDRKINTNFPTIKGVDAHIEDKSMWDEKYTNMSELSKYKYLLNLNGCGGGWSVRLKYLFMCGSLVFYITNYNAKEKNLNKLLFNKNMDRFIVGQRDDYSIYNLYNIEYWMLHSSIQNNIILATDVNDCAKKIEYYNEHQEEAFEKAKRAREYTSEILSKKNVMLYWKILLETYSSRFDQQLNKLICFNQFILPD